MTESNKTYPKSSGNTRIALGLGALAVLASGFLIYKVNDLDQRYGRIAEDIDYYDGQLIDVEARLSDLRGNERDLLDSLENLRAQRQSAQDSVAQAQREERAAQTRLEDLQAEYSALLGRLHEAQDIIAQADRLRPDVQGLNQERDRLREHLEALQVEVGDLEDEEERLSVSVANLDDRRGALQRQVDTLAPRVEELRAMERRVQELEANEARLNTRVAELRDVETERQESISELDVRIQVAGAEFEELTEDIATARVNLQDLEDQQDSLRLENTDLQNSISAANAALLALQREQRIAQSSLDQATADLAQTLADIEQMSSERAGLIAEIAGLNTERAGLRDEITSSEEQLRRLQAEVDRLEARRGELEDRLLNLEGEIDAARADLAAVLEDAEDANMLVAERVGRAAWLETEIERLQNLRDDEEAARMEAVANAETARASAEAAEAHLQDLVGQRNVVQATLLEQRENLAFINDQIETAMQTLEDLRQQMHEFRPYNITPDLVIDEPSQNEAVAPAAD